MAPVLSVVALVLRILLAVGFAGMGINHFVPRSARGMAAMIPPRLRSTRVTPRMLVYFTGLCEIAGGIGLLVPATRVTAAIALVVFLAAVFPANAYAAQHRDRFGAVAVPFWPRLTMQIVLAALIVVAAFA